MLAGTVAADDWVGGLPLATVQTGTVTGDLYISGNPPSATYTTVVDRTFTLPTAAVAGSGRVKWARLYVSSYCGHMQDAKAITYTTKVDWNNDGTWDNNWTESDPGQPFIYMQGGDYGGGGNDNSEFTGHDTGEPYLMLNDHTTRVTSDYLSWYDVTNLIQENEPTIKVNVDATGSYDGRIKMVELVVAYDDPSSTTETQYWINEGHDACTYYTEENEDNVAVGTTTFDTSGLSGITSATLIADYMASNNGYYGFPTADNDFVASAKTGSFTNTGLDNDADTQGPYSGIDSWNVTSSISGSSSTFAYARYLPGTGTSAFYKIPLVFLVAKKPLQSSSAPDAEFSANVTNGKSPFTVRFNDSSTGSPTSWQWDFNNDGTVDSTEQNPSHIYSTAGTYDVNLTVSNADGSDSEVKTEYITVTSAATNDLSISGIVNTVPGSAVFAKEPNTIKVTNVMNTGTASLTNISVAFYASDVSNGTVPVNTTTISSLAGGAKTTVSLIDPTIRNLEDGTVTYTSVVDPDNLIPETNEENNNKSSSAKPLRYNGYKGKGIYWEGESNITTKHTYDLQGNLLYSTQPDTSYKAVGWTGRTEIWTADDLPIPSGSTIEKAFLYFAYNWDQTPGGYPWLNLNFNGNTIENGNLSTGDGTLYRDWSNFGGYADYEYGLCVYDVTDKFNETGNSLVTSPYGSSYNKVALYPSTLVVIYRDSNETRKQIFINEECDELGVSMSSYGTTSEEATAYAPFTGMSIDKSKVTNATMYSFAGSAGPDEGNLLFNGNTVAPLAWQGSSNSASPLVFNVKNYINETENEAGIQGTTSGGMDALQQILVVEYQKEQEAAPVANFTANVTSGTAPLDVQFTDASTGTVSSYTWDFDNDGTVDSTEQNPVYTYTAAGNYTVNLTVSNSGGSDSKVKTEYIVVSEPLPGAPVADFAATPTSGDAPLTVNFTDASTGTVSSYSWDFNNDGNVDSTEQNPVYTYAAAGNYTVNLTVANTGGSDSKVKTEYIVVSEPLPGFPVANFTANRTSGTAPLDVQFTDASIGNISSYTWDFDNNGTVDSTEQNPVYTYTAAGNYTVNLTVSNSGGSDSKVKTEYIVVSEPLPGAPVADFTATPTSGDSPLTVNFTDVSTGTVSSYAWDLDNDGTVDSIEQNPVYTYAAAGTYTVNLTVTGPGGSDSEVKTGYIEVSSPSPSKLVAAFSASPTSGKTPLNVKFTDTSTGSPASWLWDFGDGSKSFLQNPIHKYSKVGVYTVSLRVKNDADRDTVTKTDYIKVVTKPVANFTSSATSGKTPLNVAFNDTSTGSPTFWKWDFGDGSKSFHQNPIHKYSKAGVYTVNLTVKNAASRNTVTKTDYIKVVTKPVANFTSSTTSGKTPLNVAFTDTSTGSPTSWKWDFGDGSKSFHQNPIHKYSKAGIYTVNLTVKNAAGRNTVTKTDYIKVVTKPVANFTSSVTSGKVPLKVAFTDTSTGSPTSWKWDFGDGSKSYLQNPTHKYSKTGIYTVNLTVKNVQGSNMVTKTEYIAVVAKPVADFSAIPTSGKAPFTVEFTDNSTGVPTAWKWSFGDGTTSTEQNPEHQYLQGGSYKVTLTVTNVAGSSTTTKTNYIKVTTNTRPGVYSESK
ncbi:cell surface protein [Methanosarcina barkeri MS]|uniref:Cell surface protein n=1 Tax=Methanosarcina barkeri MS TaxID=1434108 RepID=A0A0E3QUQ9_METBA|nr:cell surface protein [Methanosarcina barkeri MS]